MDELLRVLESVASPRRRELLQLAVAGVAAAGLGCRDRGRARDAAVPRFEVLSVAEARTLEAATARILPAAPGFAGARDAEVIVFVDRQLATPDLAPAAAAVRAVAAALDAAAARPFADAPEDAQDELLAALAAGRLAGAGALPQPALFGLLHTLTLEGFLADPRHGGNAGEAGWRAIGFPAPPRPGHH